METENQTDTEQRSRAPDGVVRKYTLMITRYFPLLSWLVQDSLFRYKWLSALTLGAGFLGVSSQVAAIGMSIKYVRMLESGKTMTLRGHTFDVSTSLPILVLFAFGILVALALSSWMLYFSRKNIFHLRKEYEIFGAKRALHIALLSCGIFTPDTAVLSGEKLILRIFRGDASYCGRAFQMILEGTVPLITFVVSVIVLFATQAELTLIAAAILAPSFAFHLKNNIAGARTANVRERETGPATRDLVKLIRQVMELGVFRKKRIPWIEKHYEKGSTNKYWKATEVRRVITEKAKLINNLLFSLIFFVIILIFGWNSIYRTNSLTRLAVYLISLRYCLVNFQNVAAKITSINRFYPQIRRYFEFLKGNLQPPAGAGPAPAGYTFVTGNKAIDGSLGSWSGQEDEIVGVICAKRINRYSAQEIIESLFGSAGTLYSSVVRNATFITGNLGGIDTTAREMLGLPSTFSDEDFLEECEKLKIDDVASDHFSGSIDAAITGDKWNTMSSSLKLSISAMAAKALAFKWIFLDGHRFRKLPADEQSSILSYLEDHHKVLVYTEATPAIIEEQHDIFAILDLDCKCITGLGSSREWLSHSIDSINESIKSAEQAGEIPTQSAGLSQELEDELEFEDL